MSSTRTHADEAGGGADLLASAAALRWARPDLTCALADHALDTAADDHQWLRAAGWVVHARSATGDGRERAATILDELGRRGRALIDDPAAHRLRVELAALAVGAGRPAAARALLAPVAAADIAAELRADVLSTAARCSAVDDPSEMAQAVRRAGAAWADVGGTRGDIGAAAVALVAAAEDRRAGHAAEAVDRAAAGLARLDRARGTVTHSPSRHLAAALAAEWISALLDAGRLEEAREGCVPLDPHLRDASRPSRQIALLRLTVARTVAATTPDALVQAVERAARDAADSDVPELESVCWSTLGALQEKAGLLEVALESIRLGVVAQHEDRARAERFLTALAVIVPAEPHHEQSDGPSRPASDRPASDDNSPVPAPHATDEPSAESNPWADWSTKIALDRAGDSRAESAASREPRARHTNGRSVATDDHGHTGAVSANGRNGHLARAREVAGHADPDETRPVETGAREATEARGGRREPSTSGSDRSGPAGPSRDADVWSAGTAGTPWIAGFPGGTAHPAPPTEHEPTDLWGDSSWGSWSGEASTGDQQAHEQQPRNGAGGAHREPAPADPATPPEQGAADPWSTGVWAAGASPVPAEHATPVSPLADPPGAPDPTAAPRPGRRRRAEPDETRPAAAPASDPGRSTGAGSWLEESLAELDRVWGTSAPTATPTSPLDETSEPETSEPETIDPETTDQGAMGCVVVIDLARDGRRFAGRRAGTVVRAVADLLLPSLPTGARLRHDDADALSVVLPGWGRTPATDWMHRTLPGLLEGFVASEDLPGTQLRAAVHDADGLVGAQLLQRLDPAPPRRPDRSGATDAQHEDDAGWSDASPWAERPRLGARRAAREDAAATPTLPEEPAAAGRHDAAGRTPFRVAGAEVRAGSGGRRHRRAAEAVTTEAVAAPSRPAELRPAEPRTAEPRTAEPAEDATAPVPPASGSSTDGLGLADLLAGALAAYRGI